jgi:hypothetical protein
MLLSLSCYLALLNSPDPAFLAGLANDPTLAARFRRDRVLELSRRHIKPGMSEAQVQRLYSSGVRVMFSNGVVSSVNGPR